MYLVVPIEEYISIIMASLRFLAAPQSLRKGGTIPKIPISTSTPSKILMKITQIS
jgi:hypothetical protein